MSMVLSLWTTAALAQTAPVTPTSDTQGAREGCFTRLTISPLRRLRPRVIDEVLPRPAPGCVTAAEVDELERRLWALSLFDDVSVRVTDGALVIAVREKWTLIPSVDLATSRQLRDGFYFASLTEYSFLGRAMEFGGALAWAEREFGGEIWLSEHTQNARRVSVEAGLGSWGSTLLFETQPEPWSVRRSGFDLGLRLPFRYGSSLRFAVLASGYDERSTGVLPEGLSRAGWFSGLGGRITYDRWEWHDLTPTGVRLAAEAMPGVFVTELYGDRVLQQRHAVTLQATLGAKLARQTVVMVNAVVEGTNPGHPHHSFLIGNVPQWRNLGPIGGIRGLPDNVYRDHFHAFANVELRHAFRLAARWFVQLVAFSDGGVVSRSDALGAATQPVAVWSAGGGVRVIPTALSGFVPRVDAGALLAPQQDWFVRFGLSQYF